jgi:hypothetical protein
MVLRHPQTRVYQPDRASRTACRTATHPADHNPEIPNANARNQRSPLDKQPPISAPRRRETAFRRRCARQGRDRQTVEAVARESRAGARLALLGHACWDHAESVAAFTRWRSSRAAGARPILSMHGSAPRGSVRLPKIRDCRRLTSRALEGCLARVAQDAEARQTFNPCICNGRRGTRG